MTTRIAVIGAAGRMGQAILRAVREQADLAVAAAITIDSDLALGADAGEQAGAGRLGVPLRSDLRAAIADADVVIDFSNAAATATDLGACVAAGRALVLCTTGLPASLAGELERASACIPLLVAANTSLGVTLLLSLVRQAAAALPKDFDIEIFEAHHRHKRDAPSGTALALGHAAAAGRGEELPLPASITGVVQAEGGRGQGIGFAVVRGGDVAGDHQVSFLGAGERLTLGHVATDRAIFARGALRAAQWLTGRPAGRYSMADVLGLETLPKAGS